MKHRARTPGRGTLNRQKDFASYAREKNNILDIGLTFYNQPLIDQKTNSQTIYGFDILERQLPPGYDHFVQGDIHEISRHFSKDYFDIILLGEVIEHVINPYKALNEISKILKNEGLLIVSTPNPHGFPLIFIEWLGIKRYFYVRSHCFLYPPRWMERMLESNELKVVKKYGYALFSGFRLPIQLSNLMVFIAKKTVGLPSQYRVANFD